MVNLDLEREQAFKRVVLCAVEARVQLRPGGAAGDLEGFRGRAGPRIAKHRQDAFFLGIEDAEAGLTAFDPSGTAAVTDLVQPCGISCAACCAATD